MTHTQAVDAIGQGYRFAQRGMSWEQVLALLEIRRLNLRHKCAWEAVNSRPMPDDEVSRLDRIQYSAWLRARDIAARHGWQIDAPGLFWVVSDGQGDIR